MTAAHLTALLAHDLLAPLGARCAEECAFGLAKDSRLLLAAAAEGVVCAGLPDYHRLTILDPLQSARNLAKDAIIGRRLWSADEKARLLAKVTAAQDVTTLLDYWCLARHAYRGRERAEALDKIEFGDGRKVDLTALKAA